MAQALFAGHAQKTFERSPQKKTRAICSVHVDPQRKSQERQAHQRSFKQSRRISYKFRYNLPHQESCACVENIENYLRTKLLRNAQNRSRLLVHRIALKLSFVEQELRPEKEQYAHINDNLTDHRERHHLSVNQNVKRKQKDHPNDIDPKF